MLLGCAIVLLCATGGAAVAVLDEVHTLKDALSQNGALKTGGTLASAGWGDPQTLLLVGDDQRSLTGDFKYYSRAVLPHANEMLLVRIDPSKPYISMMSIPRELQVTIFPPHQRAVTTRFNYAYTAGGIPLLVSTIKRVTGLSVNHVMVITFARFRRAVDQMGCVYSTVDRRYLHVNAPGGEQYQEINLRPGYQKLCGTAAMQFVSYRHGDTSLVRDARDQSFLLDVKKQYGPTLAGSVHKFETIFGKAVQTDPGLHSTTGILNLLGTLISSSGRRVRQVHFQANLGPSFDTASKPQIASSVHAFLYGGSAIPKGSTAAAAHAVRNHKVAAKLPLEPTGAVQLGHARAAARSVPFTLEYPRVQERGGVSVPPALRTYLIHAPGGTAYPIYTAVFAAGPIGQYYDVQGTNWTGAPMFSNPEQTIHVGGRTYDLFYEGSNLKVVAWSEHGAVYWVRNSLSDAVSNGDMLAIAEQTTPVGVAAGSLHLKGVGVPVKAAPKQTTDLRETVGAVGGVLTLIAVPVLGFLALRRRRELGAVRTQLESGLERGARLPLAPVPFEPGSAAARAAERARLARQPGSGARPAREDRHRSVGRKRTLYLGVALAVIAAGAVAFVLATSGGGSAKHPSRLARTQAPALPTVPVAVLNAGTQQGAAKTLADQLRGEHVNIGSVGNLAEARPPGMQILYAPGQSAQASRLAHLLSSHQPVVAPIDPATSAAVGSGAQLVVVVG
ncbi:MAG TPA: LCP family protein [Solirubrobacteraceae bacterium]|jgi:LCP family protein required for cell wall assembly